MELPDVGGYCESCKSFDFLLYENDRCKNCINHEVTTGKGRITTKFVKCDHCNKILNSIQCKYCSSKICVNCRWSHLDKFHPVIKVEKSQSTLQSMSKFKEQVRNQKKGGNEKLERMLEKIRNKNR